MYSYTEKKKIRFPAAITKSWEFMNDILFNLSHRKFNKVSGVKLLTLPWSSLIWKETPFVMFLSWNNYSWVPITCTPLGRRTFIKKCLDILLWLGNALLLHVHTTCNIFFFHRKNPSECGETSWSYFVETNLKMGLFSGITILKWEMLEATNGFQTKKINPEINLLRKQKISAVSFPALASPPHKSMGAFVGPSFHQSCFFSFF